MATPKVEDRIARLQEWSRAELVAEWEQLHGRLPPKCTSLQFMIRVISWHWQVEVYGGLSKRAEKLLESLIQQYKQDPGNFVPPRTQIKSGTRLQRLWKGRMHEVEVTADGRFNYQGHVYSSPSKIARLITGVRWNGHAFFGLRKGTDVEAS